MRQTRSITAEQAALRIGGMNAFKVIESIPGSRMGAVDENAVAELIRRLRSDSRAIVGGEVSFAMTVRGRLWPTDPTARFRGKAAYDRLPQTAFNVFGPATLKAAAAFQRRDLHAAGACLHCFADAQYAALDRRGIAPNDSPPFRALIGDPCGECADRYSESREHAASVQRRGAEILAEDLRARARAKERALSAEGNALLASARAKLAEAGALSNVAYTPAQREQHRIRLQGAQADAANRAFSRRAAR